MKTLNVLHLASFVGNIGDNANHKGIRRIFKAYLNYNLIYDELEIRDFYMLWKKKFFDKEFVNLVNQYDLLMIGGGNFFDLCIDKSVTGTTLNISEDILQEIQTPILFFGLGCDPYKGVTEEILGRFKKFLDALIKLDKSFISVRNDGSIENIKKYVGNEYVRYIHHVPDGGFFTKVEEDSYHPEIEKDKKVIAINVAGDMPHLRFKPELGNEYSAYGDFVSGFSKILNEMLQEDEEITLVFVPHIFKDLKIISEVMDNMNDEYRRKRITVAPYLHGVKAHDYIFDIYKKSNIAIGMRFHTNVCSIAFNTVTIPLATEHFKVRDLYIELGLENRIVNISRKGFEKPLKQLIKESLSKEQETKEKYARVYSELEREMKAYCSELNNWLKRFY